MLLKELKISCIVFQTLCRQTYHVGRKGFRECLDLDDQEDMPLGSLSGLVRHMTAERRERKARPEGER